jgi:polyisoprenoid-binding protein YceI
VFTFKEGILSKVAHDLRIRVERFETTVDGARLDVRVDPRSLRVETAMRDGREAKDLLEASDFAKIEDTIRSDVLEVGRFPELSFQGEETSRDQERRIVAGTLLLHGVRRPLTVELRRNAEGWTGRFQLDQRDHGMTPYRAMLGTLRLKPHVRVEVTLPP